MTDSSGGWKAITKWKKAECGAERALYRYGLPLPFWFHSLCRPWSFRPHPSGIVTSKGPTLGHNEEVTFFPNISTVRSSPNTYISLGDIQSPPTKTKFPNVNLYGTNRCLNPNIVPLECGLRECRDPFCLIINVAQCPEEGAAAQGRRGPERG